MRDWRSKECFKIMSLVEASQCVVMHENEEERAARWCHRPESLFRAELASIPFQDSKARTPRLLSHEAVPHQLLHSDRLWCEMMQEEKKIG
jgi:hypothetical protein